MRLIPFLTVNYAIELLNTVVCKENLASAMLSGADHAWSSV